MDRVESNNDPLGIESEYYDSYEDEFLLDENIIVKDDIPKEEQMEFLNHFDYNLNSPVILDHVIELKKRINKQPYNKVFEKKDVWDNIELLCKKLKMTFPADHENISQIHRQFFRIIRSTPYKPGFFEKILDKTCVAANETKIVLESFCKGWIGKQLDNPEYHSKIFGFSNDSFRKWGNWFWSFHKLTLLMNGTGPKEMQSLDKTLGSTPVNNQGVRIGSYLSVPELGDCYIISGYLILPDLNQIWDRNFLLMGKDLMISRVQTIISMLISTSPRYLPNQINNLITLYLLGDEFVALAGNLAYDGIKLIEPVCNLRFCQLAHEFRPLIPLPNDFENHVKRSITEKSLGYNLLSIMFQSILKEKDLNMVLTYYSVFRHWGHPTIEYMEGLEKLHQQVMMEKVIDDEYAQKLASNLAFKILKKTFFEKKKWFVDITQIPRYHVLYKHFEMNTWPNSHKISQFGSNWHKLPIQKIYEIPDLTDPSLIYSDKSHSMQRSEILNHIRTHPNTPIPTRRVLQTLLTKPETNWREFLQKINDEGLSRDSLVIGLRAKEREMKRIGRFFSLMSWELREYFVYTEFLIKEYFVPLFKGLTMADDLQSVINKMLENCSGQGLNDYKIVSIANHIDYEKWNNHQRFESNQHIFRVMGMCFGLENLFLRSHQFFEESLIYYVGRPDLLAVVGDTLVAREGHVCWNGQKGGLEGLRQKGWSIVNLLVLEEESKHRNTMMKILAQGDNQTISLFYELNPTDNEGELRKELQNIVSNNNSIMDAIRTGTGKLGLIINEDETMVSADYLNYGKVPIFRGIIRGLDAKRWSRVNFTTNDQVPNLANTLSSVSTNALTVSHYSADPMNAMVLHNFYGNFTLQLLDWYNPAVRAPIKEVLIQADLVDSMYYKILMLYLDPSLGGVGGTSLTRFLIRMFPDPITESLSFWKVVHDHTTDKQLKSICCQIGEPKLEDFSPGHLDKLIESPTSLNLKRGISSTNLLKNEVKINLIKNKHHVANTIIKDALTYVSKNEVSILNWARSIKPLFPRFISEMVSSTYYGITMSLVGLFQNSRTIRNQFKTTFQKKIDLIIHKSELSGIASVIRILSRGYITRNIWRCSSTLADDLRKKSWAEPVLGTTIPHPMELIGSAWNLDHNCQICPLGGQRSNYISLMLPKGLGKVLIEKGPYPPYLGSKTSERTSILQPWDKESSVPIIRRACKLRNAISWFVEPDSNLAKSILNNLEGLTGEFWGDRISGFKRTGSALHRFTCSRQSNGGFSASSPTNLTWMICTTDTMTELGDSNYDFMFQSLLIYSQATTGTQLKGSNDTHHLHFHINCTECLREITEPNLDSGWEMTFPAVDRLLASWRPDPKAKWGEEKVSFNLPTYSWESLSPQEKSFQVGQGIGFIFTDMLHSHSHHMSDSSLFPLGISGKIIPRDFFSGLLLGINRSCSLALISRRNLLELQKPRIAQWGAVYYAIEQLTASGNFTTFISGKVMYMELITVPQKVPPSYPLNQNDLGLIARTYLKKKAFDIFNNLSPDLNNKDVWVFSDLQSHEIIGSIMLGKKAYTLIMCKQKSQTFRKSVGMVQEAYINIKTGEWSDMDVQEVQHEIKTCDSEIRHACKFDIGPYIKDLSLSTPMVWGSEVSFPLSSIGVSYSKESCYPKTQHYVPQLKMPLVSGLRLFQHATGAHYKIRSILSGYKIQWNSALVGGDGSGGISAYLCRSNANGKVVFNSLLELDGVDLKGSHPAPPSAITGLGQIGSRCVNADTVWKYPSDLSQWSTWQYFKKCLKEFELIKYDLMIFDMEVTDLSTIEQIEAHVTNIGLTMLSRNGCLIFKSYYSRIMSDKKCLIDRIGGFFESVLLVQTGCSSSFTSEVYIVCKTYKGNDGQDLYPIYSELWDKRDKIFCHKANEFEFRRAIQVKQTNMFKGVPREMISDIKVDWSTLLVILGIDTGYAVSLSKESDNFINQGLEYGALITVMTMEATYPTWVYSVEMPGPPSNPKLRKGIGMLVGYYLWASVTMGDMHLFQFCKYILDHGVTIYFGIEKRTIKTYVRESKSNKDQEAEEIEVYHGTWSFWEFPESTSSKFIKLDRDQALLGQVIRLLQRLSFPMAGSINLSKINSELQSYNKGMTIESTKKRSDSLYIIQRQ
ncbi:polymerase [Marco virus]|uniref:RNA-directed RNA polymerase L n=3 Tax=Marco virus TaxID=1158190 RepID=A0A0D3R1U6_9RHAB|nr:polymerase [Marco virus]AJR28445.1 polymerase [Marco virus]